MSSTGFPHLVRGLLVVAALLLAVLQIGVLASQRTFPLALNAIFPITMAGR